MLQGAIALFVGLFFVLQVWLAILESRVGPFASHTFRAGILVLTLVVPAALVLAPWLRARRWRALQPRAFSLALFACVLISALWLFESVQPFNPDHDDTFRAGFVHAVLGTGFPPALRWWLAVASGHVRYYVFAEDLVAQMAALLPHLTIHSLYVHQLKVIYLVCELLLGFSIARDLGALEPMAIPNRPLAATAHFVIVWCAFLMLVFGAAPFELATLHLLGVSQSAIVHVVLLLFLALTLRRTHAEGRERVAIDVAVWTLPALLAAAKLPYLPAFLLALGVHWLAVGAIRTRGWRALLLPLYAVATTRLALQAVGLTGAAKAHALSLQPLLLFHELAPHWFSFTTRSLFWRVSLAFGIYDAPILLLAWLLSRRRPLRERLRSPAGRAILMTATILGAGYFASATFAFVDREGANELYWFVQGFSALSALVFLAIVSTPPSWWKLLVVPFALYAVHDNQRALRHAASEQYAPLDPAALDACAVAHEWAVAHDDRARTVVAGPFANWDFAGCSELPTLAPPADRYDRILGGEPLLPASRAYQQQLLSADRLPPPPAELQPALARFAHILIVRPRGRPLSDGAARLVGQRGDLLFYDWPTRSWR